MSTSNPLYGIDDLKLGYVVIVAAAAGVASGATSVQVLTGQGVAFAGATVGAPVELTFGTEKLLVTARATDALTVTRAAYGTTAAAIASGQAGYAINEVDMGMCQNLVLDANLNNIEYTGDGTKVRIPVSEGISGHFNLEFWTEEFHQFIAGCTPQTTNLPADETSRIYPELGTYPNVRIRGRIRMIDTSTGGATGHKRLEVPKAVIQRPTLFGDIASTAATKFEMSFTAVQTAVDISGAPLPGVTNGNTVGVFVSALTS